MSKGYYSLDEFRRQREAEDRLRLYHETQGARALFAAVAVGALLGLCILAIFLFT